MDARCPYCYELQEMTEDHVFSQFFGGRSWIPACKECNDSFGHEFEGRYVNSLTPLLVLLGINGIKPPKTLVWKKAYMHEGVWYDLSSDDQSSAGVQPIKNDKGRVIGNTTTDTSEGLRSKILKGLSKLGKVTEKQTVITIDKGARKVHPPNIPFDENVKRLAIKMCVALSNKMGIVKVMSATMKEFLLTGDSDNEMVYLDMRQIKIVDALRPDLAHLVYVEGNPNCQICYGIVQIFGFYQLFVILDDNYTGTSFAVKGVHHSLSHLEEFTNVEPLEIDPPPTSLPPDIFLAFCKQMIEKLNTEMKRSLPNASYFMDTTVLRLEPRRPWNG